MNPDPMTPKPKFSPSPTLSQSPGFQCRATILLRPAQALLPRLSRLPRSWPPVDLGLMCEDHINGQKRPWKVTHVSIVGNLVRPNIAVSPFLRCWGVRDKAHVVSHKSPPRPLGSRVIRTWGLTQFLPMVPRELTHCKSGPGPKKIPVWNTAFCIFFRKSSFTLKS